MGPKGAAAEAGILAAAKAAVKLGFDDEEAANSIATLFQRTGDLTTALKLNGLAMDISRAKTVSLEEANKMISLVMSGNARALKMYGIEIDETLGPMQALEQLQQRVAGQAEGFSKTFQGQISVFKIEFQNLLETIGTQLLPILTKALQAINPIVDKIAQWSSDTAALIKWLKEHQAVLIVVAGAIAGALTPALIALATTVLTVVIPAFAAAAIALAPFIIGGAVIAGIGLGVLWIIKHWDMLREKARQLWQEVPVTFRVGAELLIEVADRITRAYVRMIDAITSAFGKLKQIKPPDWLPNISSGAVGSAVSGAATSLLRTALPLPRFERGGIVPGAEGTPVPIMAHGQERIIPANRSAHQEQQIVYNFVFNDVVAGDDGIKRIIRETVSAINRQATLSGVAGQ
jgi:hypothetical protein